MKKQKQFIRIGGEDFELQNKPIKYSDLLRYSYNDLNDCFTRWSDEKERIYCYYRMMLEEDSKIVYYGIKSFNCNFINLNACIEINDTLYYVYITKIKNLIHRVVFEEEEKLPNDIIDFEDLEKRAI